MSNTETRFGSFLHSVFSVAPGLKSFAEYRLRWLRSDFSAGLSVAAIALPVGIAYADLADVPPVVGMYSAIFPLFAYALFGSSRQLMTGPDAATCLIVAASLGTLAGGDSERYLALMFVLTLMTGVLYILAGLGRLGFIANFLSRPILTGYLNGIALIIIADQLKKLFGYNGTAKDFFPLLGEFVERIEQTHLPTLILGLCMLALLVLLRRFTPKLPAAFFVVVAGIAAVWALGLDSQGVAILGNVPAGFPSLHLQLFDQDAYEHLFRDAAGIMLVSFTSGVLTAKSFARRNRYDIDANQELIAFGSCNLASGLAQGFPVTGADSRTAVNNAMGGKTQLVGIVAALAMLLILFFLTTPLELVPTTALAAVIVVSAVGLFDFPGLRALYETSRFEFILSVGTTLGVLVLGVLPGVLLTIALSLLWLLSIASRPHDAKLGRVRGMKGFHDVSDHPEATTVPGLILYRFDANLVFFNADYFRDRIREAVAASSTPVEWVVVDGSPINVTDVTAIQKIDELREELAEQGIVLAIARMKRSQSRFFNRDWVIKHQRLTREFTFPTLKSAIHAFNQRTVKGESAVNGEAKEPVS